MTVLRHLLACLGALALILGVSLASPATANTPEPDPTKVAAAAPADTQRVSNPKVIVRVDDDSTRGVRIYKGVNCTTPAGAAEPIVIAPGYTSEAFWVEPISFRYYEDGRYSRTKISDGSSAGPDVEIAGPNHTAGQCWPKNGQRLTNGVNYRLIFNPIYGAATSGLYSDGDPVKAQTIAAAACNYCLNFTHSSTSDVSHVSVVPDGSENCDQQPGGYGLARGQSTFGTMNDAGCFYNPSGSDTEVTNALTGTRTWVCATGYKRLAEPPNPGRENRYLKVDTTEGHC